MTTVTPAQELLALVAKHDYSYEFSDSHAVWERGNYAENRIKRLINQLVKDGENPKLLLQKCLEERTEQFKDGLTHKIINGWFKDFIS